MSFEDALLQGKRLFACAVALLIAVAVFGSDRVVVRHVHKRIVKQGSDTRLARKTERKAPKKAERLEKKVAPKELIAVAQERAERRAARLARHERYLAKAKKVTKGKFGLALPVRKELLNPHEISHRHHDYPAWDVDVKRGTPVFAIRGGKVIDRYKPRSRCGRGLTIKAVDCYKYTYCHGHKVLRREGKKVKPGQVIMKSGTSGNSTGTHLHVQIQGPNGKLQCPQRLIRQRYRARRVPTWTLRPRGCVG